jgi:hypothetical protein
MGKKHQIKVSSATGRTNASKKWRRKRNELFRMTTKTSAYPCYNRASRRKQKQIEYAKKLVEDGK